MSNVSVEAFRQAFLDPESRIRLHSDLIPEPHAEFLAMSWEGGFLRNTSVHFNENLNVLVGGRGAGKSTMIESIRYALDLNPLGEDAKKPITESSATFCNPARKSRCSCNRTNRPNAAIRLKGRCPIHPLLRTKRGKS